MSKITSTLDMAGLRLISGLLFFIGFSLSNLVAMRTMNLTCNLFDLFQRILRLCIRVRDARHQPGLFTTVR
jgi:hypothetical protein